MKQEAVKKALRLLQMQRLFFRKPGGYRTSELAEIFYVDQRTISRDLEELQGEPFYLPLMQESAPDWRWHLVEGARFTLPPLQLTLQQGAALYLAARLLQQASDEHNPYVEQSLSALAAILPSEVGDQIQRFASANASTARDNSTFVNVFETLTLAWATGRVVHIWHRSANSENVHDYLFHPYLIEPAAIGYATYVIGWASWFDAVHTFKLERITRAEMTEATFEIPSSFDGVNLLRTAWGIAYADPDKGTQTVRLKFPPGRITRRVKESQWHSSQIIEDTADGGCIFQVEIGQAWEMKPFIRGWGPDCEVLEPQWLREEIAEEMRRAVEVYEEY